jgi:hypothetical protein
MTQWYDAGLAPRTWQVVTLLVYDATGIAPHTETQRWSYTTPTGKASHTRILFAAVNRRVAPTTANLFRADIRWNGSSVIGARSFRATAGDVLAVVSAAPLALRASDVLSAVTQDISTGGYVDYHIAAQIIEAP